MANLIQKPTMVLAAGNKPKEIAEYVGRLNSATEALSIAHMNSPAGWIEPGQIAEFGEYTVVLRGTLRVETRAETIDVKAGQAILARRVNVVTAPGVRLCPVCGGVYAGLFSGTPASRRNDGSHASWQITPDAGTGQTDTTTVRARE